MGSRLVLYDVTHTPEVNARKWEGCLPSPTDPKKKGCMMRVCCDPFTKPCGKPEAAHLMWHKLGCKSLTAPAKSANGLRLLYGSFNALTS